MKTKNILKFTCNFRHFKYFRHFKHLIIVLLTFNFILSTFNCSAQSWQWAKSGGGSTTDHGKDVCYDNNGNVYMVGNYYASPSLAPYGIFDSDTVPYYGYSQIFLVKYSGNGNVLWTKSIGGNNPTGTEAPMIMCYDKVSDAIYLAGTYYNTMILGNDTLTGSGDFLTKIDVSGNYLWTKKLSDLWFSGLATDNNGILYASGECSAPTTIDTINIPANKFLAKFNSSGNCIMVNSNFSDLYQGQLLVFNNDIFIIGNTNNDTIQIDTLIQYFTYSKNCFVARFNNNLHLKWVSFATSTNQSSMYDICTDSIGNSYVCGLFATDIDFGDTSFTGWSWGDLFIAKYDSNGVFQWAKQGYNTTGGVTPYCKSLSNGDFYVAGGYDGTDLKLGNYTISISDFIARYNSSGNCLNVVTIPGNYQCEGLAVGTDNSFSVIGYFLGSLTIGGYGVTSHGFGDVYVAKHDMITGEEQRMMNTNNQLIIYANPNAGKCTITIPSEFNTETKLTLQIFDTKGNLLQQTPVEMMQDKISVNITAEAKGIYTAVLINGIKSYTGKIIFE